MMINIDLDPLTTKMTLSRSYILKFAVKIMEITDILHSDITFTNNTVLMFVVAVTITNSGKQ